MGLFGKSFNEKVNDAIGAINASKIQVNNLGADVDGKVVTLKGSVPDMDNLKQVVNEFNNLVNTENTFNQIKIEKKEEKIEPDLEPTVRIHQVVSGDTLGKIAKMYYGEAKLYMKIFEANKDILDNPDLIKVGQMLKIPDPGI